ncbi:hypothetical protein WJX82_006584 [Trebouxia sp. C0006]
MHLLKRSAGSASNTQVVQEFVGYSSSTLARSVYIVVCVLTGGLGWLICQYIPHSSLWTMHPCSMSKAQSVLAKLVNGRQELVKVRGAPLQASHQGHGSGSNQAHRTIELLMVSYLYDAEEDAFLPIPDMPPELPLQLHNAISQLQAIAVSGAEWSQFNPITTWLRKNRCALYGLNDITFARPNLFLMIAETLSYPIFVIQYLELAFEVYERWYTYAAVLFFITLAACMASSIRMYMKRMQLYRNVHHQLGVSVTTFDVQSGVLAPFGAR